MRPVDRVRAMDFNSDNIFAFMAQVESAYEKYNIEPSHVYNLEETVLSLAESWQVRYLIVWLQ